MAKAVFTTKPSPSYDDLPEFRYHFPRTYLRQVEAALDDRIVYYEPRRPSSDVTSRGGRQAYFATARVDRLVPDPRREDHFYAHLSEYLEFDRPVPFQLSGTYLEQGLRKDDGSTNKGAFGRAVRSLSDTEYQSIIDAGFATLLQPEQASPSYPDRPANDSRWLWVAESIEEQRQRVPLVGSRWFRDRAFTARVREVYDNQCAFTGLRILNGGGRPEVQAAHIQPVASQGPDTLRNGLALSGTVHWMFDRGLISLEDDGKLLVARGSVPGQVRALLRERAQLPANSDQWPHPQFLRFHREHIFKGVAG